MVQLTINQQTFWLSRIFNFWKFWSRDLLTYFSKSDLDIFPTESCNFVWWRLKPYQLSFICENKKSGYRPALTSGQVIFMTCPLLRAGATAISREQSKIATSGKRYRVHTDKVYNFYKGHFQVRSKMTSQEQKGSQNCGTTYIWSFSRITFKVSQLGTN